MESEGGGGEVRREGSDTVGSGTGYCICDVIFPRQNPQSTERIDVILHLKKKKKTFFVCDFRPSYGE
jgi:hypothetical protein